jgi:transketolase
MSKKSELFCKNIKVSALKMVHHAKSSHIGSCFSIADIMSVLYTGAMNIAPETVDDPDRDRLILSKGHAAAILYSSLAHAGFIPVAQLETYCDNGSPLSGHATHCNNPGVELSTGSLGHGLAVGIGFSLAAKQNKGTARTYVILSDGECDEGSNWEGILFAPHHNLDNLVVIVDYNKIQSFGRVEEVLDLHPFVGKWQAFNWNVIAIDGHDHDEIHKALSSASEYKGKPTVIIANTVKGQGVSFMEDTLLWHYKSPSEEQLAEAIEEIERGA